MDVGNGTTEERRSLTCRLAYRTINGILAMKSFKAQFTTGYFDVNGNPAISPSETSLVVAILSLGAVFGSLLAAPMGDRYGRRASLNASICVFTGGVVFQVAATKIPLLLVGRFLAGVGVGSVAVLAPLYESEMAPKWIRGTLVCAYQLFITVGLLTAAIVNILTNPIETSAAYRIPMGLQLIWACILSLGLLVLPETPRYLVKQGRKDEAALSLSRLRRLDITHPALIEELAEIQANHEYELALGPDTYRELITGSPHLGRRTLTGCGLQILQQMTGVNFIMYYGTTFFNGVEISNPFTIMLIMQVINTVSTLPGLVVVESWGRRNLLMIGAFGMAACQLLIAAVNTAAEGQINQVARNQILIIFVCIFLFFFATSWGPVVWVVTSEIYPLKVRAKAMSLSTASNWLLNFGIAYGTPFLVEPSNAGWTRTADLGTKVFFLWGAFCIMGLLFVKFMVYETSRMSLEQIDEMYERVDCAWRSKSFEPSWSFQQMRDYGFSDSGVPPQGPGGAAAAAAAVGIELHATATDNSDSSSVQTSESTMSDSSPEAKIVSALGNIDFSY